MSSPSKLLLGTLLSSLLGAGTVVSACSSVSSGAAPSDVPGDSPPGTNPDASTTAGVGALPCEVDTILATNCRTCHSNPTKFGAPMPLVTFADLHADAKVTSGKKVYEMVGLRIHDDAAPMPQPPNPRLDAAQTATLDAWIAAGAPAGTAACNGTAPPTGPGNDGVMPLSCTPDQQLRPGSKWAVTNATDEYVCYGFDTNASEKRHVIAGAPHIDNASVVHHVLVYQSPNSVSPKPAPCGAGGGAGWRLVTGWTPGGLNFEMPPEAGFAEEAGVTHWAVQVHYNNAGRLQGQVDESGYDFCSTTELRPNDADVLATGTLGIEIPPRSKWTTTCMMTMPAQFGTINVISAWPHLHRLGTAASATRFRDAQQTTILDAPNYSFNTGGSAQPVNVEIKPGDKVRTICSWQNTSDRTVKFGEGTADEMCFAFMTYYPKIQFQPYDWKAPSMGLFNTCSSTK